jgi:hypothetical protein
VREKESLQGNFDKAFETIFRISTVFIEGSRIFVFIIIIQGTVSPDGYFS